MPPKRVCAFRSSSARPAYSKDDLVRKAVKKGKSEAESKRMTKKELCEFLKLKLYGDFPKTGKPKRKKKSTEGGKREKKEVPEYKKRTPRKTSNKKKKKPVSRSPSPSPRPSPEVKKKVSESLPCITASKLPLKDYQIKALVHLLSQRGLIVGFETGMGKTLVAIVGAFCWLREDKKNRVKVILSPSLKGNFKKEMSAYGADPEDKRFHFYSFTKFAKTHGKEGSEKCTANDMIIVDEAHELRTKITSTRTSRASVTVSCSRRAGKVLLLTATPVYNMDRDVVNLLAMVKGERPLQEAEFRKLIANENKFISRYSGLIALSDRIKPKKEKKKESLFDPDGGIRVTCGKYIRQAPDFPQVRECDVEITMSKKYYKAYRAIEHREISLGKKQDSNPWVFYSGLRQAANSVDECLKCNFVMDVIYRGKKTVIHSSFLGRGVEIIEEELKSKKIKYAIITGSMKDDARTDAVKKYNSNKVKVLLISRAGGQGIDLKGTRYLITLEPGWNDASEEQVQGRAARYLSHEGLKSDKVDVYRLYIIKPYFMWEIENMADDLRWSDAQFKKYVKSHAVREDDDDDDSADIIVRDLALKKTEPTQKMNDLLRKIAI